MSKVSAIVLAAGTSSRMGTTNKLLLPVTGKPMVRIIVEELIRTSVEEIFVVTGHEAVEVERVLQALPVKIVSNPDYERGMTSSIQRGVRAASGDGYMICLSDMPFMTAADYMQLATFFREKSREDPACICTPVHQGKQGHPVVFSAYYRQAILQHQEPEGCKSILRAHPNHLYMMEFLSNAVLKDLDTPEDYQLLR